MFVLICVIYVLCFFLFFFFKQKTAYEMRISDWSSDVCSSDLRNTETFSHMGGEGAAWIGQKSFTREKHVFVNLGDGTYFHSGILAIRAAIAANANITYKILYNDAVAMTGDRKRVV